MAELTYTVFTGELVVVSDDASETVIAFCESGSSNHWWSSSQKAQGQHGRSDYMQGGPIPIGRWRVHSPGSVHPDGGRLRPQWIPIGPAGQKRTHIYLHPRGRTDGCIAVDENFDRVAAIVKRDGGGWITVTGGDLV